LRSNQDADTTSYEATGSYQYRVDGNTDSSTRLEKGNNAILLALVLPLVGVGLLVSAIKATRPGPLPRFNRWQVPGSLELFFPSGGAAPKRLTFTSCAFTRVAACPPALSTASFTRSRRTFKNGKKITVAESLIGEQAARQAAEAIALYGKLELNPSIVESGEEFAARKKAYQDRRKRS